MTYKTPEDRRSYNKQYNINHKEQLKQYRLCHKTQRKQYEIDHKEQLKRYRIDRKEEKKQYDKQYNIDNREHNSVISKQWVKDNPEKVLAGSKRHLTKYGSFLDMTSKEYHATLYAWSKAVKHRDINTCQICGSKEQLQAHHVIYKQYYPQLSLNVNNGVTLCLPCHNATHWKCI